MAFLSTTRENRWCCRTGHLEKRSGSSGPRGSADADHNARRHSTRLCQAHPLHQDPCLWSATCRYVARDRLPQAARLHPPLGEWPDQCRRFPLWDGPQMEWRVGSGDIRNRPRPCTDAGVTEGHTLFQGRSATDSRSAQSCRYESHTEQRWRLCECRSRQDCRKWVCRR